MGIMNSYENINNLTNHINEDSGEDIDEEPGKESDKEQDYESGKESGKESGEESGEGSDEGSDEESDEELMEEGDDDFKVVDFTNTYENMIEKEKKTLPIMSKFEKARVIGVRAQQIADGAIPTVKVPVNMVSTIDIAKLELKERKLPLIVRRVL